MSGLNWHSCQSKRLVRDHIPRIERGRVNRDKVYGAVHSNGMHHASWNLNDPPDLNLVPSVLVAFRKKQSLNCCIWLGITSDDGSRAPFMVMRRYKAYDPEQLDLNEATCH